MRLRSDLSGAEPARRLERPGYVTSRQTGSHMRLTCASAQEHHLTEARHDPLRIGTLAAILADVAAAQDISRDELLTRLFG
jgi:predicted RNA binding protein YcfA (HicA-like mRNA interferase family)